MLTDEKLRKATARLAQGLLAEEPYAGLLFQRVKLALQLAGLVSAAFARPVGILFSSTRGAPGDSDMRQAYYFALAHFGFSHWEISRLLERDRSTVSHGISRFAKMRESDVEKRIIGSAISAAATIGVAPVSKGTPTGFAL